MAPVLRLSLWLPGAGSVASTSPGGVIMVPGPLVLDVGGYTANLYVTSVPVGEPKNCSWNKQPRGGSLFGTISNGTPAIFTGPGVAGGAGPPTSPNALSSTTGGTSKSLHT